MKNKGTRSLMALLLVLTLLVSCLPVLSVGAAEAEPVLGDCVDFAPENTGLTSLTNADGNIDFGISGRQANGPFTFPGMAGNTWYISTVVNFSSIAGEGAELCFGTGDVTTADATYTGVPLRVRIFNNANGEGRFWVMYAGGAAMSDNGKATLHSVPLDAFAVDTDYKITIKVAGGDLLSVWLDGVQVVDGVSLSGQGVSNVSAATGWRAYIGNGAGCFKNGIQVWDGVTEIEKAPTLGEYKNFAEDNASLAALAEANGAMQFGITGRKAPGPFTFSGMQGNTWYVSAVVNFTNVGSEGVDLCFGTGNVDTYTGAPLRVRIFNNASGAGRFWVQYAGGTAMSDNGAGTLYSAEAPAFAAGTDYTVTVKVENGDKLSIWLGNTLVMDSQSLSAKGVTNVTAATGWRAYSGTGSFKNGIQVWDGVTEKAKAPALGEYFDFAAESTRLTALKNTDGTIDFGISGRQANGPFTFSGMAGNTWYVSTVMNFSSMAGEGAELCFGLGDVSTYTGVPLRVRMFNHSNDGKGRFWVMYAGGTAMNATGAATLHSAALSTAFATGTDYQVTIVVENGDALSIWLDGVLVMDSQSLSAKGVTNVTAATGWRAYIGNGAGCFKNGIQVWDGVTEIEKAPVLGEYTDFAAANADYAALTNSDGSIDFGYDGGNDGGPFLFSNMAGNNWNISAVVNFADVASEGVDLCFGIGDASTYVGVPLRVRMFNNSNDGKGRFWVQYAGDSQMATNGVATPHSVTVDTFKTNTDYTVTVQMENGNDLSVWLGNTLVIDALSLSSKGITNVQPATGWRAYSGTGSFKNGIQAWDGVTTGELTPPVQEPTIASAQLVLEGILKLEITTANAAAEDVLRATVGDDSTYQELPSENGVFTVKLPAHRLYEDVKLELVCGGVVKDTEIWTAEAYAEEIRKNHADDTGLLDLVDALLNYGTYAAYYADPTGAAPAVAAVESVSRADIKNHQYQIVTKDTAGLKPVTALYLDDACDLRVKFDEAAFAGKVLLINGEAVEMDTADGKAVYEILEILPQNWADVYNIRVVAAGSSDDWNELYSLETAGSEAFFACEYRVLSYVYAALGSAQELQPGLNGLLKSMYLYYLAADAYQG